MKNIFEAMSSAIKNLRQVPIAEITESFSRSGGAGGQNVNKVNTKVELRWPLNLSTTFSKQELELIKEKLKNRLTKNDELLVVCQEFRTQEQNRVQAYLKLNQLINQALMVEKERKNTQPTFSSQQERLQTKKKNSLKKQTRKKII